MPHDLPVTAVIINFKTAELTRRAVTTLRACYPTVQLLLVDNASRDKSTEMLQEFAQESPHNTSIIVNERNLHHGPAMDQALRLVHSPYVLFLDSDCEIIKGNFLELMIALGGERPNNYAIGKMVFMNKRGFDVPESEASFAYIRPSCMLIKREWYPKLPRFERHGTPCLANMIGAVKQGLTLVDFPVDDYIIHRGRGTAGVYGYRLGLRGKLNYILSKIGL